MEPVTLRAHFDGKQIVLDEPTRLERNDEIENILNELGRCSTNELRSTNRVVDRFPCSTMTNPLRDDIAGTAK